MQNEAIESKLVLGPFALSCAMQPDSGVSNKVHQLNCCGPWADDGLNGDGMALMMIVWSGLVQVDETTRYRRSAVLRAPLPKMLGGGANFFDLTSFSPGVLETQRERILSQIPSQGVWRLCR